MSEICYLGLNTHIGKDNEVEYFNFIGKRMVLASIHYLKRFWRNERGSHLKIQTEVLSTKMKV